MFGICKIAQKLYQKSQKKYCFVIFIAKAKFENNSNKLIGKKNKSNFITSFSPDLLIINAIKCLYMMTMRGVYLKIQIQGQQRIVGGYISYSRHFIEDV